MGYSADAVEVSGPIVIKKERVGEVFAFLLERPADEFLGGQRWSWTDNFVEYEQTPEGLLKLFTDYGFYGDLVEGDEGDLGDGGDVHLQDWGGDQLGSSADDVWGTLARFANGDVRWVFRGEDGELWADCIEAGQHVTRQVRVTVLDD